MEEHLIEQPSPKHQMPSRTWRGAVAHAFVQKRETVEIVWLYVLMIAGGLWHILGVLQTAMEVLSTPMIIVLAAWSAWNARRSMITNAVTMSAAERSERTCFYEWCGAVFVLGCVVETVGVQTGAIFGEYTYNTAPIPALMPIAIGSAWLGMMLASTALAQRLFMRLVGTRLGIQLGVQFGDLRVLSALMVGLLMAIFDGFMEPAATALHYWAWAQPYSSASFLVAPFQNYAAWFVISVVFSFVGLTVGVGKREFPRFVVHSYWAQLLYFVLAQFR